MLTEQVLIHQRLQQRAPQRIERRVLLRALASPVIIVVIAGVEQGIRQTFHQVAKIKRPDIETIEFSVASEFHFNRPRINADINEVSTGSGSDRVTALAIPP